MVQGAFHIYLINEQMPHLFLVSPKVELPAPGLSELLRPSADKAFVSNMGNEEKT